jgi:hypothetical protein
LLHGDRLISAVGANLAHQENFIALAVRLVQEAVDAGVNFLDNAWEYNDHRSEEWMGLGLQGRLLRLHCPQVISAKTNDRYLFARFSERPVGNLVSSGGRHLLRKSSRCDLATQD